MKNDFRQLVDRNLSGLQWDDVRTQRVLHALEPKGEPKMKKKFSMGLALAMICVLLATVAVAAGITYSQRYQLYDKANALLEEKYGITPDMQSYFSRIRLESDGMTAIRYEGLPDFCGILGSYTVFPEDGTVTWSLDGQATGWGADQMAAILLQCQQPDGYAKAVAEARKAAEQLGLSIPASPALPEKGILITQETTWGEDSKRAKELSILTMEEAEALARMAIQQQYALTDAQLAKLEFVPESTEYCMLDDTPLLGTYFWLCQDDSGWTEKDGVYIVNVNMLDGSIETIWYDTALLGNG